MRGCAARALRANPAIRQALPAPLDAVLHTFHVVTAGKERKYRFPVPDIRKPYALHGALRGLCPAAARASLLRSVRRTSCRHAPFLVLLRPDLPQTRRRTASGVATRRELIERMCSRGELQENESDGACDVRREFYADGVDVSAFSTMIELERSSKSRRREKALQVPESERPLLIGNSRHCYRNGCFEHRRHRVARRRELSFQPQASRGMP